MSSSATTLLFEGRSSMNGNGHSGEPLPFYKRSHTVVIDYARSLDEMIAAARCQLGDPRICPQNFHHARKAREIEELVAFQFCRDVSTQQVLITMQRNHYRPATIFELLAFVKDRILYTPLVALGSRFRDSSGREFSVCVGSEIILELPLNVWPDDCEFLGVQQLPETVPS